jgi:hypothetical protein
LNDARKFLEKLFYTYAAIGAVEVICLSVILERTNKNTHYSEFAAYFGLMSVTFVLAAYSFSRALDITFNRSREGELISMVDK